MFRRTLGLDSWIVVQQLPDQRYVISLCVMEKSPRSGTWEPLQNTNQATTSSKRDKPNKRSSERKKSKTREKKGEGSDTE